MNLIKKYKCLYPALLIVCFAGCATTDFTAYDGPQNNWPTGSGGYVSKLKRFEIWQGLPSRQYEVVGRLITVNASDSTVARIGRSKKADAAILEHSETRSSGYVNIPGSSTTYSSGSATVNQYGGTYNGSAYTYGTPGYSVPTYMSGKIYKLIRYR